MLIKTLPFILIFSTASHASSIRISWLGLSDNGTGQQGIHSRVFDGPGQDSFRALPEGRIIGTHLVENGQAYLSEYVADRTRELSRLDLSTGVRTTLFTLSNGSTLWNFGIANNRLYYTDSLNDEIWSRNLDGGDPQLLFDSPRWVPSPTYMALGRGSLFWSEFDANGGASSQILGINTENPSEVTTIISGLRFSIRIANSDSYLFWTDYGSRTISRSGYSGENLTTVLSMDPSDRISWLRADEDHLYWNNNNQLLRSDHNGNNRELLLTSDGRLGWFFIEPIPEPTSALLSCCATLLLFRRKRSSIEQTR